MILIGFDGEGEQALKIDQLNFENILSKTMNVRIPYVHDTGLFLAKRCKLFLIFLFSVFENDNREASTR